MDKKGKDFFKFWEGFVEIFKKILPKPVVIGAPDPTLVELIAEINSYVAVYEVPTVIISEITSASLISKTV